MHLRRRLRTTIAALAGTWLASSCGGPVVQLPYTPPEFTHTRAADWINSEPLKLATLRGKVVLVEFWASECADCLNSAAWVESIARREAAAGLVVVGVHTPELSSERSTDHVRGAVARLGIRYPVMLDTDYSYWKALHNQYWPEFYLIGRDGQVHGWLVGALHEGDARARQFERLLERLLS